MQKNNQYGLVNILPMQGYRRVSPITTKEAKALMDIWNSETDGTGKKLVPITADFSEVENLISKGVINNTTNRPVSLYPVGNYVEITRRGKDLIKTIILHTEQSSFNKKAQEWNVEEIFSKTKIASSGMVHKSTNWLDKILWK